MIKKTVTLTIDEDVYEKFQKICDQGGMSYSKKIQVLIENFIKGR